MKAPHLFVWIAIAVFLGLSPGWAEAQCLGQIGPNRDGLGELCPGRFWNPAGLQMFQDATYNKGRDEYFINTSTWDGANGESIATVLRPDGTASGVNINISGFGGTGINGVTAVATEYNSVRGGYLATWRMAQAPQLIYGRYLGDDGTPISPPFGIGQGDPPSMAYSPQADRYLVTWSKLISGIYYTYYALIAGDPTAPTPVLATGLVDTNALSAVTAYNPTSQLFLIVFVKDFAPNARRADIFGRTISTAGTLGGVYPINTSTKDQQRPVLAASNTGFAVLYEDWNSGGSYPNAVGMLLDQNGAVLPQVVAAGTSPTWEVSGAITYNETTNSYFVAWRSAGNVGLPQHWMREFDAVTGQPRDVAVSLTTQDSMILSTAARNVPTGPQAIALWAKGAGSDGVHAGIHPLPPQITTQLSVESPTSTAVLQPFTISGWAVDPEFPTGTGVETVHIWAYPTAGGSMFLGSSYGVSRPDVATTFGNARFENSGFSLNVNGLANGTYLIRIYAKSSLSGAFDTTHDLNLTIGPDPRMGVDLPVSGSTVSVPFNLKGWAIDRASPSGPGVDMVHVYAYPNGSGTGTFLGAATYGEARPDIAAAFGDNKFTNSGFTLPVTTYLPAGQYQLQVWARSTVTGTFSNVAYVSLTIVGVPYLNIDVPTNGGSVGGPFKVSGWALDTGAAPGTTGIDAVHVWAFKNGVGTFLGEATLGISRPDVGAFFGDSRFNNSGYSLTAGALPQGTYTIRVYARTAATSQWKQKDSVVTVVGSMPIGVVDTPTNGSMVSAPFDISGWAVDLNASVGTGIDAVHIWASSTGGSVFLGEATLGVARPDVGTYLSNPNFNPSGYKRTVSSLSPGTYTVVVWIHSVVSGSFTNLPPFVITVN